MNPKTIWEVNTPTIELSAPLAIEIEDMNEEFTASTLDADNLGMIRVTT